MNLHEFKQFLFLVISDKLAIKVTIPLNPNTNTAAMKLLKDFMQKFDIKDIKEDVERIIELSEVDDYVVWALSKLDLIKIKIINNRKFGLLKSWFAKILKDLNPEDFNSINDIYKNIIFPRIKLITKWKYKIDKFFHPEV